MIKTGYIVSMYKKKVASNELSDDKKIEIIKDIIPAKEYITFKLKQEYIKKIIKDTTTFKDGKLIYNSCDRYYSFMCMLLNIYFNIEIEDDTYDRISEIGILGYMIHIISDEYNMLQTILDSYMSDLENGRLSLESL